MCRLLNIDLVIEKYKKELMEAPHDNTNLLPIIDRLESEYYKQEKENTKDES